MIARAATDAASQQQQPVGPACGQVDDVGDTGDTDPTGGSWRVRATSAMIRDFSSGGGASYSASPIRAAVAASSRVSCWQDGHSARWSSNSATSSASERVRGVRAGQGVQVDGHASTPMQSRIRINPSRSRVLTVPSGTDSSSATSL